MGILDILKKREEISEQKETAEKKAESKVADEKALPVDSAVQTKKEGDKRDSEYLPWPKIGGRVNYIVTAFKFQVFVGFSQSSAA